MAVEQNPTFWGAQDVIAISHVDLDAVAMLANGGYVVAFRQDEKIGFQIYNGNGEKVGSTHLVAEPAGDTLVQWEPDVLAKADGSFMISWTETSESAGGGRILRNQTFGVDGTPGTVNTVSDKVQYDGAHIANNGAGGTITAYINDAKHPVLADAASGEGSQINNPDGTVITASGKTGIAWLGGEGQFVVSYREGFALFQEGTRATRSISKAVETNIVALQNSDGTPNGKFAVNYLTDTKDIIVKTYSVAGQQIVDGKTFTISSGTLDSNGYSTSITALQDGGFAVAYKVGTSQVDIWVKVFDAEGNEGPALQIPVYGAQVTPSIEEMPDGRLAVSWHNRSPSTGGSTIETVIVDARASATKVTGTADNDIYAPSKHAGDDFDGGAGIDTLTFKESTAGVAVNLAESKGTEGDATGDTYKNFENVIGSRYGDNLIGGAGANSLDGGAGNDTLDGGADADALIGGSGNDVYILNDAGDVVQESSASDGGIDTVYTSVSHVLEAYVENMIATGSDAITLTGNDWNNSILGNDAANQILGGGGNDVLNGAGGNDALDGGTGNDVLYGGAGADNLKGGIGDDVLDGQGGADIMDGGAGNDTYYVDDANDVVRDSGAGDVDTVIVSVDYDLNKLVGIENITGVGSASITLMGNAANNQLIGNNSANIIYGGAGNDALYGYGGNDRLHGGLGADLLVGGSGRDTFVFDTNPKTKGNKDKIADFNVKDDTIYLENKYFKVGSKGTLNKPAKMSSKMFYVGAKAHDKDDRIIYDKKKGVLYYDDDGIGSHKAVVIATLKKGLKMTYKDFFVI